MGKKEKEKKNLMSKEKKMRKKKDWTKVANNLSFYKFMINVFPSCQRENTEGILVK